MNHLCSVIETGITTRRWLRPISRPPYIIIIWRLRVNYLSYIRVRAVDSRITCAIMGSLFLKGAENFQSSVDSLFIGELSMNWYSWFPRPVKEASINLYFSEFHNVTLCFGRPPCLQNKFSGMESHCITILECEHNAVIFISRLSTLKE